MKKDGAFNTLLQVFGNNGKEALAALRLAQKLQPAGRCVYVPVSACVCVYMLHMVRDAIAVYN